MATVAERLAAAHEELLTLYTTIPVLTPCLDTIKTNQAEFVALNNRIRHLQEEITISHGKADRMRKQLDWAFTLGKKSDKYQQETNKAQALETERRTCLRQRDDVVTVRYRLHNDRDKLLHMTRQLKKLTESVFDRSKDEVANADFPEELYWQLELKECDEKIGKSRIELGKFQVALVALSRAANLCEAALMAFLGYVNSAYKVWSAEYALQASRKMRLYLRVELSLSNAYSNFQSARASIPQIVHSMDLPIPASTVQGYFEPLGRAGLGRKLSPVKPFDKEPELRAFIAHLRACHKAVERIVEQETILQNGLLKYRDSVVPKLAKIRRHVFQESCLGGYQIEGWEDENGRSLLGTEADVLVRGGVIEVHENSARVSAAIAEAAAEAAAAAASGSFRPVALSIGGSSGRHQHHHDGDPLSSRHGRRSSRGENPETTANTSSSQGTGGPLSTVAPSNQLGSQVLMEVDRDRRARAAAAAAASSGGGNSGRRSRSKFWRRDSSRSRSRSRVRSDSIGGDDDVSQDVQSYLSRRRGSGQTPQPPVFNLLSSRRSSGQDDAVVPTVDSATSSGTQSSSLSLTQSQQQQQQQSRRPTHQHGIPSLSISHVDDLNGGERGRSPEPSELRPQVMTMDEYVGVGEVERTFDDGHMDIDVPIVYGYLDPTVAEQHRSLPATSSASSPGIYVPFMGHERSMSVSTLNADTEYESNLIPTYAEHQRHRPLNPEDVFILPPSLPSLGSRMLAAETRGGPLEVSIPEENPPPFSSSSHGISSTVDMHALHRLRSRSLSPSPHHRNHSLGSAPRMDGGGAPNHRLTTGLGTDELGRIQETSSVDHRPLHDHYNMPPPEYTA